MLINAIKSPVVIYSILCFGRAKIGHFANSKCTFAMQKNIRAAEKHTGSRTKHSRGDTIRLSGGRTVKSRPARHLSRVATLLPRLAKPHIPILRRPRKTKRREDRDTLGYRTEETATAQRAHSPGAARCYISGAPGMVPFGVVEARLRPD